jgi:dynein intermediate chain, cytosolic
MASRQNELQAKKARLAELKRQRELRHQDPDTWRQSVGAPADVRLQAPWHNC